MLLHSPTKRDVNTFCRWVAAGVPGRVRAVWTPKSGKCPLSRRQTEDDRRGTRVVDLAGDANVQLPQGSEEIDSIMAIPVLWRTKKARYSLQGEVCPECARLVFPPRQLCPYCGRPAAQPEEVQPYEFSFRLPNGVELQAAGDD